MNMLMPRLLKHNWHIGKKLCIFMEGGIPSDVCVVVEQNHILIH